VKNVLGLALLLSSSVTWAQTMSEQKLCAEQGEKVFKGEVVTHPTDQVGRGFTTHYNAKQHACFVALKELDFFYSGTAESRSLFSILERITIQNAFEGTLLGNYIGNYEAERKTTTVESCALGKKDCENKVQFRAFAEQAGYGSIVE
jgi:hypothetical protein